MEPFSTVILLASLAGMPATMVRNWGLEKKDRPSPITTTHHIYVGGEKASTEITFVVDPGLTQTFDKAVNAELDGYASLKDGWDGEGSIAPSHHDIARAIAFVDSLPSAIPLPKPMVSADGQIGLYWSKGEKYADINFDPDDTMSIYARNSAFTPPQESYLDSATLTEKRDQWLPMLLDLLSPMRLAA